MKLKSEMESMDMRLGLVALAHAAIALYNMGFYHVALLNIAQMRLEDDYYFPQDYRDCPCCDENYYDDGYASDNWSYVAYGDGAYEDMYSKTPRDVKRDRERRNTDRKSVV